MPSEHCITRVGTPTLARSPRLSERTWRAKRFWMSGSMRQKLAVSSAPSTGRSTSPVMAGAVALDQPR